MHKERRLYMTQAATHLQYALDVWLLHHGVAFLWWVAPERARARVMLASVSCSSALCMTYVSGFQVPAFHTQRCQ